MKKPPSRFASPSGSPKVRSSLARVRDYIGQGVAAGAELVVDGRDRASAAPVTSGP